MSMSNITLMLLILCFSAFLYDASPLNSDGVTLLSLLTHWTFFPSIIYSTWNASDSVPCSWHGVQCNHAYHVISLNLTDLGIHGQLGPEIGQLYRLKILVLSKNGFSGKVPSELSNCSLLELLDLSNNMFNGQLPLEMEDLKNLKNISLFSNQFSGVIPQNLGINSSLVKLDFTNNKFTGNLPPNLCFRKQLRVLNMGSNHLHGSIPSDLGRCPTLVMLILSENNFTGSLPVFESNVNLKYLHISKNRISGKIPRSLENCTNLAAINMSINNFTGLIPSALGKLVNLMVLDLSHNNLEGPLPQQLSNCTKMDHFDVGFNSLNSSFPSSLRNWTEITTLVLRENHFTGGIPVFFSELSMLRELQLGGNLIGGTIPPSLGKLKNLFYGLNLSSNGLTGVIPIELGYLQELQSLDLSLNNLTGNVDALDKLLSLIDINISYNFLYGPVPKSLFKFLNSSSPSFLGNPHLCVSCSPSSGLNCTNTSYLKLCPYQATDHRGISALVILMIELGSSLFGSAMLLVALLWMCHSRREMKNDSYDVYYEKWGSIFERGAGRIGFLYKEEIKFTENQSASLHDLVMEATENLNDQYIIGRGAHGIVYRAQLGEMAFAVKKIAFARNKRKHLHVMRKEIEVLGKIKHRNLVTYADYWIGENYGMVLYEYMKNGSLHDILHQKYPPPPLSWNVRLKIAVGIAHGLKYLHHDHTIPIVHRDIKPQNILLNDDMEPLISDFGTALYRDLSEHSYSQSQSGKRLSTYVAGTAGYIAPENAYVIVQSRKSDVYSYGVVLLELLTRKRVVIEEGRKVTGLVSWVRSIWLETGKVEQIIDSDLANAFPSSVVLTDQVTKMLLLALSCTERKPRDRPTMKVIIDFYQQHIFKLNCYDVDVGIIEGIVDVAPQPYSVPFVSTNQVSDTQQDIYVEKEPQDSNGFSWWQNLSQSHLGVNDLADGFIVELIGNDVKQEIFGNQWTWNISSPRVYSAKIGYQWLLERFFPYDTTTNWIWLWKLHLPEKIRLLLCLCLHSCFPTAEFRHQRNLTTSSCPRCNVSTETLLHCLRDCSFSRQVWSLLGFHDSSFFLIPSISDWLRLGLRSDSVTVFSATLWCIWLSRNDALLWNVTNSIIEVAYRVCLLVHDIGTVSPLRGHLHSSYPIDSWVKPADGFVKVNCDGSVYVDEGRAGFGCVLRDSSGHWIFGCSGIVVGTCVLRTKLWAIWRGLYMALQQNQTAVECETDSVDAFYLVNHWQIPQEHEEKELIQKVFELKVRPGRNVTFNLIHRGANRVADWMSKLGARANCVAIDWINPPSGLQQLLELDNS